MDRVNLFVIGVNKAGTSWLYYLLDSHPDIFMAEEKELYYFGEDYPEDIDAYHEHFPFHRPYQYYGEATPFYCQDAAVAREIHDYCSRARLLAIVRDPIQRLLSQFYYHKQLGFIDESVAVDDLMGPEVSELRENSRYEKMLPVFAETFGSEQFKVLSLEEADDPVLFWDELQQFLDLQIQPLPDFETASSNATGSRWFRAFYRTVVRPIKDHTPGLYRTMLRSRFASEAKTMLLELLGTAQKAEPPQEVTAHLREEFAPTYDYLRELGFECYEEQ